jgi:hypothetical protein
MINGVYLLSFGTQFALGPDIFTYYVNYIIIFPVLIILPFFYYFQIAILVFDSSEFVFIFKKIFKRN